MIRAIVADDTTLYRTLVSEALATLPDLRVVATAATGRMALSKALALKPDVLTLDIEMPEMNGIEVLESLAGKELDTAVIVVSSLTPRGGELTMRALELGAVDFVLKPERREGAAESLARSLGIIVAGVRRKKEIRELLGARARPARFGEPSGRIEASDGTAEKASDRGSGAARGEPGAARPRAVAHNASPVRADGAFAAEIAAVGSSTGGPQALMRVLPALSAPLAVPVVVVQHMPPLFTANLAASLSARCAFPVREAAHGETLRPGTAYVAPGGSQLRIALAPDATTKILALADDPPENNCRPSVDYTLRSIAQLYYGRALVAILTGMGSDGARGAEAIRRSGGRVIAQDEATSVVWGMPKAVVDAGIADAVLPLEEIAPAIDRAVVRANDRAGDGPGRRRAGASGDEDRS